MEKIVFVIWAVDALLKVFPTTLPPATFQNEIVLSCARNEWESGQIAFRSEADTKALRVTPVALKQIDGNGQIDAANVHCQFEGFIPIKANTPSTPADELICKAPSEVPDVLLEDESIAVSANRTQPIWIGVYVPQKTPAGNYSGEITVEADGQKASIPIKLRVFDFTLPDERHLFVTNWFNTGNIANAHHVELNSDEFFAVLEKYARNMADHRENVFWVSPWTIKTYRENDGKLTFDYSIFDRYIQTFLNAGVNDRIEIMHVAHHGEGGWESKEIILNEVTATDRQTGASIKLSPEEGLGPFLTGLQNHLEEKNWLSKAMIHISDEPTDHNFEPWKAASQFVHRFAPKLRRIDAIETDGFEDLLEVWVPKLNQVYNWYPYYDKARQSGVELWYYICLHPTGRWMNRFLDYPLLKIRLLHWINYRYTITGYLHWGWNFWGDDPFGAPKEDLPPGDTHVIYPGKDGPLNSIRWETQRDSLEDFEYLVLLKERRCETAEKLGSAINGGEARSDEYCRRIVRSFVDFERDEQTLRSVREKLATEVDTLAKEPLILVDTIPTQDLLLVPGPIVVRLAGVTHPGAKVTVEGAEVPVNEKGNFETLVRSLGRKNSITINVDWNGQKKTIVRDFNVMKSE